MHKLSLAAIAAACLSAAPAMAQTNSTTPATPSQSGSSSSAAATPAQSTMSQADLQKVQQKISSDLKSDGYTNVQVMPNSFLVHATNKRNEPVMMIINPDSVFAVTEMPGGKQTNAQNTTGSNTTKQ